MIDSVDNTGHFGGTLSVRAGHRNVRISVYGHLFDDGTLSFQEQVVLEGAKPDEWDLGSDDGSIDSETGALAGMGVDSHGHRYSWYFER